MSASPQDSNGRRRSLRFAPDPTDTTVIGRYNESGEFKGIVAGIIVDESRSGAGLIFPRKHADEVGDEVVIKVGRLGPIRAHVRWKRPVEDDLTRIGVEYFK